MGVILSLMMGATYQAGTPRYLLMRAMDVRCMIRSFKCIQYGTKQLGTGLP